MVGGGGEGEIASVLRMRSEALYNSYAETEGKVACTL